MTPNMERHLRFVKARHADATYKKRRRLLVHLHAELSEGIDHACEDELIEYFAAFTQPWTLYTYDTHARSYYRWCVDRGLLTHDPMRWIPKPKQGGSMPNPCDDRELAVALTAPAPYGRAILLASRAGLRCGEIARAHRSHLVGSTLTVIGKGGRERAVPLDDTTMAAIAGDEWLVGRKVAAASLTDNQRPVWQSLGLPDTFRLHAGRHWYATRLAEAGVEIRVIQELLGHASVATTMGYTQVTAHRLAAAVAQLPRVTVEPVGSRLDGYVAA